MTEARMEGTRPNDRWTKTPDKIADGKPRWELAARTEV